MVSSSVDYGVSGMADTGSKRHMGVESEGVDLEMATLISAVVDRRRPRKDALSKRVRREGPQLRRHTPVRAAQIPNDDPDILELTGIMDEVKRDAAVRAEQTEAAPALAPEGDVKGWLADAVIAKDTMARHGDLSQETRFAEREPSSPSTRKFTSNPFRNAAPAAVAAPVAAAMVAGREDDDAPQDRIEGVAVQSPMAEAAEASDAEALAALEDAERVDEAYYADEVEDADIEDADIEIEEAPYAAALLDVDSEEAVPVSAAVIEAQSYQEDEGGLPVWLAMGIPVAAVSMVALVAGVNLFSDKEGASGAIETVTLAPLTVTSIDADEVVVPPAAPVLANAPVAAPEAVEFANVPAEPAVDTGTLFSGEPAERVAETVPETTPRIVDVIAPVTRPDPEPAVATEVAAPVLAVPSIKPSRPNVPSVTRTAAIVPSAPTAAPERAYAANVPSLKPQTVSSRRSVTTTPKRTAPAVFRPTGRVPTRMFDGHFERGSAALTVNAVAAGMGSTLNKSERNFLARDVERALDNEVDGRHVSLKSARGDRIALSFSHSGQELRQLTVARESGVAPLPRNMVLEGGWYAARSDVQLRATPSISGTFSNRIISRHTLIERMATITDRYGDRWYLMGRNGVAVGYMSPADLMLAEAADQPLGLPYNRRHGNVVNEVLPVYTRCRTVFVGPLGETRQKMDVCRNAKGNWIGADQGIVPVRHANARPEPIVLASAVGASPELVPFEDRRVRKALTPKLVYARAGQVIKQTLSDGRDVELTLGPKYEANRLVPVVRLEALGRIDKPMRLDARWMRVPGGASLRATPDYLATLNVGAIPAGHTVQTIGEVEDDRGESWILVGRNGVGFGYVQRQELMPLAGNTALRAVSSARTASVVDMVESVTDCRSVAYEGAGLEGTFTACQQPNGQWALSAEPELRQLVDVEPSSQVAP